MNKVNLEIGLRLRTWRKASDLRLNGLTEIIKVAQGSLSGLENGKSLPSATTLTNLWTLTNLNIIWLLTGKGKMLKDEVNNNSELGKPIHDFIELMTDNKNRTFLLSLFEILQSDNEKKKTLLRAVVMGLE